LPLILRYAICYVAYAPTFIINTLPAITIKHLPTLYGVADVDADDIRDRRLCARWRHVHALRPSPPDVLPLRLPRRRLISTPRLPILRCLRYATDIDIAVIVSILSLLIDDERDAMIYAVDATMLARCY